MDEKDFWHVTRKMKKNRKFGNYSLITRMKKKTTRFHKKGISYS